MYYQFVSLWFIVVLGDMDKIKDPDIDIATIIAGNDHQKCGYNDVKRVKTNKRTATTVWQVYKLHNFTAMQLLKLGKVNAYDVS